MAVETLDFYIKPRDRWVLVATNPVSALVKPAVSVPWWVAITTSGAPNSSYTPATATLTFTGSPSDGEIVTIDGIAYRAVTAYSPSAPGARDFVIDSSGVSLAAVIQGRSAVPAVAATGTITFSSTGPLTTETATIGSQVYTFVSALTAGTGLPGEVLIGVDINTTADNLTAAVNGSAGSGTLYGAGTVTNTAVTSSSPTNVVTLTAITAGYAGNSIVLTEAATNVVASGSGTLSGGTATVPAVTAHSSVSAAAAINVVTLTAISPGTPGNAIAVSENLTNVALSGATLSGGLNPLVGVSFGRDTNARLEPFQTFSVTGEVYIRIEDTPNSFPDATVRFGVIRQT